MMLAGAEAIAARTQRPRKDTSSMPLWYDIIMIVNSFPYANNNYYPQVAYCSWACDRKVRDLEYIIVREGFHCSWKLDGQVFSN